MQRALAAVAVMRADRADADQPYPDWRAPKRAFDASLGLRAIGTDDVDVQRQ